MFIDLARRGLLIAYISTQVYAELINPKIGEDTDRMREKIGGMFRLAN